MRLFTVEQWLQENPGESETASALKHYHATCRFNRELQALEYFNNRLEALDALLNTLSSAPHSPLAEKLKKQAENKQVYLNEVPKDDDRFYAKSRLLTIRDQYWFETADPLHRAGPEILVRMDKWKTADIPSFFIFLETIEYDPGLSKYAPYEHYIAYFDHEQRNECRLEFSEGRIYLKGVLFDTEEYLSQFSHVRYAIYVLGEDEHFYILPHLRLSLQHSSIFSGRPVLDAGEIKVKNGILMSLSNRSGHYAPTKKSLWRSLNVLKERLGDLKEVDLHILEFDQNGKSEVNCIVYDANEYLDNNCLSIPKRAEKSWTPLHALIWTCDLKNLLVAAAKENYINAGDAAGNTPLHLAAKQGFVEGAQVLLDAGARIDAIEKEEGNTPLHFAAKKGNKAMIELFLTMHGDPMQLNSAGESPLHLAAKFANAEAFKILLDACDKKFLSAQTWSIWTYAVQNRSPKIFEICLRRFGRKYLFNKDEEGNTLLHFAAANKGKSMILRLLKEGLSLNASNKQGDYPLHVTALKGGGSCVKLILDLTGGSQAKIKNCKGKDPLKLGAAKLNLNTLKLLLNYGADPLDADNRGMTVFHYLAQTKSSRARENLTLLIQSIFPNSSALTTLYNNEGRTPLELAILNEDADAVYWLLALSGIGS